MTPEPPSESVAPDLFVTLPSYLDPNDLTALFPAAQPIELELGAGDGSFILEWAKRHPERNFLAVERLFGRIRKIDRRARRAGMRNIRVIRVEAGYFFQYLIPPSSLAAVHIYFPDPWPKRKHWGNRLINQAFPGLAARALIPGSCVFLRTDSTEYFAQMQSVFSRDPRFEAVETPPDLTSITTDFERDFNARGIPTLRAAYRLAPPVA